VLLLWLALFFYFTNNYYATFLRAETKTIIFYLIVAYTAGGFLYYLLTIGERQPVSKGLLIIRGMVRTMRYGISLFRNTAQAPTHEERTAILFGIVKVFFLPLMLNFLFFNIGDLVRNFAILREMEFVSTHTFNTTIFPLLIALIFTVDTLYFAFGYTFEATFLDNAVRSVEPTILGWAVTLISYPPFNGFLTVYLLWYANDFLTFPSELATTALRVVILSFLFIYVWASVALGAKCSNLTNRGVVARGPYAFVRHPAYSAKNIAWWITVIPLFNPVAYASMFAWSTIYYLRAVTEERHLMRDPEYQSYTQKVRWKFFPGIW
jgi:protein-S-isoprenylcysteine O-methyltransferase Ste14